MLDIYPLRSGFIETLAGLTKCNAHHLFPCRDQSPNQPHGTQEKGWHWQYLTGWTYALVVWLI